MKLGNTFLILGAVALLSPPLSVSVVRGEFLRNSLISIRSSNKNNESKQVTDKGSNKDSDTTNDNSKFLPTEVCTPDDVAVDCVHELCDPTNPDRYVPGTCYEITELYQTKMVPDMRACYTERYPNLLTDAGLLWNQRVDRGIPSIASAAAHENETIAAKHMQIDIALGFDHWDIIDRKVNEILEEDPTDPHALFVKAVYGSEGVLPSVENPIEDFSKLLEHMYEVAPKTANLVDQFYADHKMLWYYEFLHPFAADEESIEVCGQGMEGNVTTADLFPGFQCLTIPEQFDPKSIAILTFGAAEGHPLDARIETTKRLATSYPNAPIIASGAAVATDKSEGDLIYDALPEFQDRIIVDSSARDTIGNSIFVADWLKENEIDNLFLITSTYHLARATIALRGVLQSKGMNDKKIYLVGAGNNVQTPYGQWNDENQEWLETAYNGHGRFVDIEIPVSYREYSRGADRFTMCDFMDLEGRELPE